MYTNVTNDITVDADAIPIMPPVPCRAWNEETQQMEDRVCTNYEVVTSDTAAFESNTWYVVTNAVSRGMITVSDNAHLILCDRAKLSVAGGYWEAGLAVAEGNSLAIYGQTLGTGELVAAGGWKCAGIGGGNGGAGGTVTIHGGSVTTQGSGAGAGIGNGWNGGFAFVLGDYKFSEDFV